MLNGNDFVNVTGKLLAQLLLSNKNIEELKIADCELPGPVCSAILESVPMAKKLKNLTLNNDCRNQPKLSRIAFFDWFLDVLPKSNLSHLNVGSTGISINATDQRILASALNMTHLVQLDIDMDGKSGVFESSKNINGDPVRVIGGRL